MSAFYFYFVFTRVIAPWVICLSYCDFNYVIISRILWNARLTASWLASHASLNPEALNTVCGSYIAW